MKPLGWPGTLRLALVQAALGAVVVLATSTMNRVMVVELALPAMLPGALVALHYAVQMLRPRLGYGSDVGGRRTPWIVGGMAVLAAGGIVSALAVAWMATNAAAGIALAVLGFLLIGVGVGACGTNLLVLLATSVPPGRRAAAATAAWALMIAGFIVTASVAGHFLDPFSPARLVAVTTAVALTAFAVAVVAVGNVEPAPARAAAAERVRDAKPPFRDALREVWAEPLARRFTIFVFVSMLAYSAQDLILEPFAGTVFGLTPGESTRLAGVQNAGVLAGMILVGIVGSACSGHRLGSMRGWAIGGCVASAAALLALAASGFVGEAWPLRTTVFALGAANGAFAIAAIGAMMSFVSEGRASREGVRMGVWGAAQAIAFGAGGFAGAIAADLARWLFGSALPAYASVFAAEGLMFLAAGALALRLGRPVACARGAFARPRGGVIAGMAQR